MHGALVSPHARPVVGFGPAAGVPEGLVAVPMPCSGGNVPASRRSDTPDGGALSDVDRDTADGVYELGETGHVDGHPVIDFESGHLLNGLHRGFGARLGVVAEQFAVLTDPGVDRGYFTIGTVESV